MKISERFKEIPIIEAKDYGSSGIDADSVNMGLLHSVRIAFLFGAITGNSILKFYAGATAGAKTTALAFSYRLGGGDYKAALADVMGVFTASPSTGLTLTAATYDHRKVIVEFDSSDMPDGKPWLTAEIDATATVMLAAADGLGDQRYENSVSCI